MGDKSSFAIVAIILAFGITSSLLLMTFTAFYGIIHDREVETTRLIAVTQVLTGWGGGVLGVLGAYVGYFLGKKDAEVKSDQLSG